VSIDRIEELLVQRATEGLDPQETAELAALGADGDVSMELAAASISLANLQYEPMPAGLAEQIAATAAYAPPSYAAPNNVVPITAARAKRGSSVIAWTAAATGLAAAAAAFLFVKAKEPQIIEREVPVAELTATKAPSEARADLLARAGDVQTTVWTATGDAAGPKTSGDVVWSPSKQQGYMRFTGLAVNDPKQIQYQLWIFDEDHPTETPVDGGVFDVSATGEVIVPIDAKLAVGKTKLFAVTIEKPGGVVVSKRERIVVTATPT
jgi:hypothetical protein